MVYMRMKPSNKFAKNGLILGVQLAIAPQKVVVRLLKHLS